MSAAPLGRRWSLHVASREFTDGLIDETRDPWSGELVGEIVSADEERAALAADAAVRAFDETRRLPSHARRDLLRRIAAGIYERRAILTELIARDAGKPIKLASMEVERACGTFELAADEVARPCGEVLPLDITPGTEGYSGQWTRVPAGPVLAFAPFNFPLNLVAHKLAPALAAGCSLLLKPPPQAPIAALVLAEIVRECGAPADAFQVLPCDVRIAESLVRGDHFRTLAFTGSAKVGWHLKSLAAKKRVLLELGGNGAVVVHRDAPIPFAARRVTMAAFAHAGQVCVKAQRAYVHEAVYDAFLRELTTHARALVPTAPLEGESILGPLIDEASARRLETWISEAVAAGARVVAGGTRDGARMPATVVEVSGSGRGLKIVDEEAFGPVLTVHRYARWDDALAMADDSRYGLQAGIFTDSLARVQKAFTRLDVGCLVVNDAPSFRTDNMPFGGVRDSGLGREGVRFAIEQMTDPKLLVTRAGGEPRRAGGGGEARPARGSYLQRARDAAPLTAARPGAGRRLVAIDGRILPPSEARVSVFDRGFLFGDSVFEVLRTYRGELTTLDEHLARLGRSAARVFMDPPDLPRLAEEVRTVVAAAGDAESAVRIILTRGGGPGPLLLDPDSAVDSARVVIVNPVQAPAPEAYENGITLATFKVTRTVDGTEAVGAKVSNYLVSLLAFREARRKGASEALVVDGHGNVCEGATSNLFIVRRGELVTPPESAGILVGITRGHVLAVATDRGMPVREATLTPQDVYGADEVFITSSIRELLPAVTVDERTIGSGRPGPVTQELRRLYLARVGGGATAA